MTINQDGLTLKIETVQFGAPLPMTTPGDLVFRNGAGANARLPVGTEGQFLKVVGGIPTWATLSVTLDPITPIDGELNLIGDLDVTGSISSSNVAIDGIADVIQLIVKAEAVQTVPLAEFRKSDNTVLVKIVQDVNDGVVVTGFVANDESTYDSYVDFHATHLGLTGQSANVRLNNDGLALDLGNFVLSSIGSGLKIKEGTNATQGIATLVAGTVTVANTKVTATTRIIVTRQNSSGVVGSPDVSSRVVGTSFTITSSNVGDTSDVAYVFFEPA